MEEAIKKIGKDILGLKTLETRRSDSLDFHDMAVWEIKKALETAYKAGYLKCINEKSRKNEKKD